MKLLSTALLLLSTFAHGQASEFPHYAFLLPDGYIGWVHIVFNVQGAPEAKVEGNRIYLPIDESGSYKTSMISSNFPTHDEFLYRRKDTKGKETLIPVPADYFCNEYSGIDSCFDDDSPKTDSFSVGRGTVGKSEKSFTGMGWFLFVGQKPLREKYAKQKHFASGEKYQVDVPAEDPIPGRIK
jgi:hypothetical protein